jgi:lipoate-protein ligase A
MPFRPTASVAPAFPQMRAGRPQSRGEHWLGAIWRLEFGVGDFLLPLVTSGAAPPLRGLPMSLEILPTRTGSAAENMATDFLLLQRYPNQGAPRFRHYDWRRAAFTFGYAQKIAHVRCQLPTHERFDLCRRPTGGGIVDHRADWTYALVIPRGHALEESRATVSYRAVHETLAAALNAQGVTAETKVTADPPAAADAGVCFERAEIHDVVDRRSGAKIAGAAQKRNKHGLLFQGSVARSAIALERFDWERFETDFASRLAAGLNQAPINVPWPDFSEDEVTALTEQYSSPEWIEYR